MTKHLVDPEYLKGEAMHNLGLSKQSDARYNIQIIEEKRNASYVIETCIKSRTQGWVNFPVNIFYQEEAHPEGSNYFGIYIDPWDGVWKICDGISAVTKPINAFRIKDTGAFRWSHYRHDFREVVPGLHIDGGRDYTRIVGDINSDLVEAVELTIDGGKVYYEKI